MDDYIRSLPFEVGHVGVNITPTLPPIFQRA